MRFFSSYPEILDQHAETNTGIIMIDEYQDTNFIQEQLIRLLGGCSQQIFVVGDDDQSIYRFRGASIGNILGFSKTYETCHTFKLDTNYRSHPALSASAWTGCADSKAGAERMGGCSAM